MELSDLFPYRRDIAYGFPPPGTVTEYEASTSCSYLEILQHRNGSDIETNCNEGSLDETNLSSWLERDVTQPRSVGTETSTTNQKVFAGGLRLLIGTCTFNTKESRRAVPFSKAAWEKVEHHLGMPDEFKQALTGTTSRAFKFSCPKNSGSASFRPKTCFIFRFGIFRPSYYQLALSHSSTTHLTCGVILSKTTDHSFPLLLQSLTRHQIHATHPLLTAALLAKIVIQSTATRIQAVDKTLNELEETSGQHEYVNVEKRNPLELDFMAATRRLNFVGRTLGVERMRAGALVLTLEVMAREVENLRKGEEDESSTMVDELIACHINECQNLALRAEYEEKRTQTQLAVVYQFMTQKEAIVNSKIAYTSTMIATEAKKDSSAMKAIAVLTMFFLPGTFLATIFAIPVFNWDGSGLVVKESFKYYWAIAIPVTVLVLLFWGLSVWVPWKEWLQERLPRKLARERGTEHGDLSFAPAQLNTVSSKMRRNEQFWSTLDLGQGN